MLNLNQIDLFITYPNDIITLLHKSTGVTKLIYLIKIKMVKLSKAWTPLSPERVGGGMGDGGGFGVMDNKVNSATGAEIDNMATPSTIKYFS